MKARVLKPLIHKNKSYRPGQFIDVDDLDYCSVGLTARLRRAKVIEDIIDERSNLSGDESKKENSDAIEKSAEETTPRKPSKKQ